MSTKAVGGAIVAVIVAIAAVILLPIVFAAVEDQRAEAPLVTRASVAETFAEAYAAGDTPTACTVAADTALQVLHDRGLCDAPAEWNVSLWQTDSCQLPADRGFAYAYGTAPGVRGVNGFEIIVTGTDPAFRVTSFVSGSGRTFCDIYGATR